MDRVKYETKIDGGVRISITECQRLKRTGVLVGSRECMACSYCYGVNREEKYVRCLKMAKTAKKEYKRNRK